MKKLFLLLLLIFGGCGYREITNDCDKPKMFVIVYGDGVEDATYPTAIEHIEEIKKYHEGKIKEIIYFCSDLQLAQYLDARFPLIQLDTEVLQ